MAFNPVRDLGDLQDLVKEEFDEVGFVKKITGKLSETTMKSNGAFNPKPYIRSFEYLIENLGGMRDDLDREIHEIEDEVKRKENLHGENVYKFRMATKTISANFEKFETELTEVSGNFVRIGEQLDRISREKSRSEEIKDLLKYFSDFSNSEHSLIDEIRSSGYSGQIKAAKILRKLNMIVAETEYSDRKHITAKQNIERYSESFEKDFLSDFERAYKEESIKKMATAAKTLVEFNGGLSVAKAYINQHPFFLENLMKEPHHDLEDDSDRKKSTIPTFLSTPPKPDTWLEQIFEHTLNLVQGDWQTISAVFPNPAYILQMFVKRIFEQTIQSYLDKLLESAEKSSKVTFLRVLSSSHFATSQLIKKLKSFDLEVVTPYTIVLEAGRNLNALKVDDGGSGSIFDIGEENNQYDFINSRYKRADSRSMSLLYGDSSFGKSGDQYDHTEMINAVAAMISGASRLNRIRKESGSGILNSPNSGDKENGMADYKISKDSLNSPGVLNDALDRCKDDLFVAFIGGGRYINAERMHLEKAFSEIISELIQARNNRKSVAKQTGIFGFFNAPATGSNSNLNSLSLNGPGQDNSSDKIADKKPEPYEINSEVVVYLLSVHSESISRAVEISKPLDLPATVVSLFKTLIDFIDVKYLSIGLNDNIEEQTLDPRSEPNSTMAFRCLSTVSQSVSLVHTHYTHIIAPLLINSPNHLFREIISDKNSFVISAESKSNDLANAMIESSINYISYTLSKQKKTDFRPSDEDFFMNFATDACDQTIKFVLKLKNHCNAFLDLNNQTRFLTEIGNALYKMLMDHFKKFVVSYSGGLVVSKDVSRYCDTVETFQIPALTEQFTTLTVLAKIFSVPEKTLKSLLEEGLLARLDRSVVISYIKMREDYRSISVFNLGFS